MTSPSLTRFLLCSAVLLLPAPAFAAIDQAGADALKTRLEQSSKNGLPLYNAKLELSGEFIVKPMDTYYAVTFPRLVVAVPGNEKIDVGVLTMNTMPGANDQQWKVTMALPSPIRMIAADGKETGRVELGPQRISMVYDENYTLPMMLDFALDTIKLTSTDASVSVDSINTKWNYVPDGGPTIWSGPGAFSFKNLKIGFGSSDKDKGQLTIGSGSSTMNVKKLDMAKYNQYQKKITELHQAGFDSNKMSPQTMESMWSILMEYGLDQIEGYDANLSMDDISVQKTNEDPIKSDVFQIEHIEYGLSSGRNAAGYADGAFTLGYNGVKLADVPPETERLLPGSMNLNFSYKNLPYREIMKQFGGIVTQGMAIEAENPDDKKPGQDAMMQSMMSLLPIFGKAGTVFALKDTHVSNPIYNFNMNSEFVMQDGAVYGGAGGVKAVFSGIDTLIGELRTLAQKPDADPSLVQPAAHAVQGLTMLQMMGQQGVDASGKPARIYDLTVDAAGATKLNGTSLAQALGFVPGPAGNPPLAPAQAPAK